MKTIFLGGAYESRSTPLAGQTLVNLFFEPAPEGAAEMGMFYGSPGLRALCAPGSGPIRGMATANGNAWVVSGDALYRVTPAGLATEIGKVPGSGRCCLARNDTQLVVMHSEGWHVVTLASSAYAVVANAPTTAQGTYQDSYLVFPNANGTYGWTAIGDASSLDALDFASAEAQPDPILSVLSDHRELWLFGETTVEVAQTSGDADLAFTRTAMIEYGCAAKYSPAKSDNTVFWLGRNESGQGVVYRAEGYSPSRVSTFALEAHIESYGDLSQAFGYCYQQNGHTFYVLTFPGHATWAFDAATQRWTQLAYRDPGTGELQAHRGNAYCFLAGMHLVGDRDTANVYALDLDAHTDDGNVIVRERAWAVIEAEEHWITHHKLTLIAEKGVGLDAGQLPGTLVLETESGVPLTDEDGDVLLDDADVDIASTGADPFALLDWSDDGCRTWSNTRELPLGRIGEYRRRAIARRLGRSRNRVYRLRISEPVKVALYGVNLDAQAGRR
jgi:hypothetical protein